MTGLDKKLILRDYWVRWSPGGLKISIEKEFTTSLPLTGHLHDLKVILETVSSKPIRVG